jgi:hypothetical protein
MRSGDFVGVLYKTLYNTSWFAKAAQQLGPLVNCPLLKNVAGYMTNLYCRE